MGPNMLGVMPKFNKGETAHLLNILKARGVLSERAQTKEIFLLRRTDVIVALRYYSGDTYPPPWAREYIHRIIDKGFKPTSLKKRFLWVACWLINQSKTRNS